MDNIFMMITIALKACFTIESSFYHEHVARQRKFFITWCKIFR